MVSQSNKYLGLSKLNRCQCNKQSYVIVATMHSSRLMCNIAILVLGTSMEKVLVLSLISRIWIYCTFNVIKASLQFLMGKVEVFYCTAYRQAEHRACRKSYPGKVRLCMLRATIGVRYKRAYISLTMFRSVSCFHSILD